MKSDNPGFDIERLQQLMELMEKHDVREMKIEHGPAKYLLRRGPQIVSGGLPGPQFMAPAMPTAAPAAPPSAAPPSNEGLIEIKSPTVGTFYQAPTPGDAAFVKVGDHISKESIVCIVEAMKVFNQIPADVSGTITKILVKDSDPVEYGQPLFLVKPD